MITQGDSILDLGVHIKFEVLTTCSLEVSPGGCIITADRGLAVLFLMDSAPEIA